MSKQNSTTKMASKNAFNIVSYKRFYGRWSRRENVEFLTTSEFDKFGIYDNTVKFNDFVSNNKNLTSEFMSTLKTSGHDPHFPEVRINGGPKLFTEEEYNEAKATVNNQKKNLDSVVDIKGIMTTPDAEFDRAMIYEATEKAKQIMAAYEQQLKTEKLLDEMMPNWRNK